ncbi:MAG: YraN family protein [Lysobacterales bacterium]
MSDQRASGDAGEIAAEQFLQRAGLRTVARNVSYRCGELDRILIDGDTLVFAEVRLRSGGGFGGARDSVGPRKQRRLIAAAQCYLQAHPALARMPCRFDVLALSGPLTAIEIEWIRDAFRVGD